ncbi:MAG: HAMP domain-containing sensor histidine kinase [Coriobacteriales bacterium]
MAEKRRDRPAASNTSFRQSEGAQVTADVLADRDSRLGSVLEALQEARDDAARLAQEVERLEHVKSDFIAVASHELTEPMSVIRLYCDMLASGVYGELAEDAREALDVISSAVARMASIVSNLTDVASFEHGVATLSAEEVDLDALTRGCAEEHARTASARGITVECSHAPCTVRVRGDAVRLRQALDNLVGNAVKYSYDAGSVQIELSAQGGDAVIRVIDEGQGMPRAGREAVFEPFRRLDHGDGRQVPGIGLGLSVAEHLVVAHGGRIDIEHSAPGEGSAFAIRLPLIDSDAGTLPGDHR